MYLFGMRFGSLKIKLLQKNHALSQWYFYFLNNNINSVIIRCYSIDYYYAIH